MSEEDETRMSRPLEDISDAISFLHGTFYDAVCNLNPDLGFLKANGESAFPHISNALAQIAQQRLVEAEDFCKQQNIDIWEICANFSMVSSTISHCELLFQRGHGLESDEFMTALRKLHHDEEGSASISANVCTYPLDEESEVWRNKRRSAFIICELQKIHRLHPFVLQSFGQQLPARIPYLHL